MFWVTQVVNSLSQCVGGEGKKSHCRTDISQPTKHCITLWVAGVLKLTFNTPIVTTTEKVTKIMVNSRYFPSNGTDIDVGGIISASKRKNTVSESKIEILRET